VIQINKVNIRGSVLVLFLVSLLGCGAGEDPLPPISSIFTLNPGDEATVDGWITVLPGAFESSTADAGFAIQDESGAVFVQVDPALALDLSSLNLGNSIRVRGIVSEFNEMVTLAVDEIGDLTFNGGGGFIFFPIDLDTGDIDNTATTPQNIASIVRVSGFIQVDPVGGVDTVVREESVGGDLFGWKVLLDDSSGEAQTYWHPTSDLDPEVLTFLGAGTNLEVSGFLNRNVDTYEVFPRGNYDISISIPDARAMTAGQTGFVRGVVGLAADSLYPTGEYGFSLHEENGTGIFVQISDPNLSMKNFEGGEMTAAELGYIVSLHSIGLYPPVRVHVEGVITETTGGDRVIVPGDGQVRLVSLPLAFPPSAAYATGALTPAEFGRLVSVSGILDVPPPGGNSGTNGWTSVLGGFRARLDDGSGGVNVFLPGAVIDPFGSGADFLTDLITYPIGVTIGAPLSVTGFLRHFDGDYEIVVLYNQTGFID